MSDKKNRFDVFNESMIAHNEKACALEEKLNTESPDRVREETMAQIKYLANTLNMAKVKARATFYKLQCTALTAFDKARFSIAAAAVTEQQVILADIASFTKQREEEISALGGCVIGDPASS